MDVPQVGPERAHHHRPTLVADVGPLDAVAGQLRQAKGVEGGGELVEGVAEHGDEGCAPVHQPPEEGAVVDGVLHQEVVAAAGRAEVGGGDGVGPAQEGAPAHGEDEGEVVPVAVPSEHGAHGFRAAARPADEDQVAAGPAAPRQVQQRPRVVVPVAPDDVVDGDVVRKGDVDALEAGEPDVQEAQEAGRDQKEQHTPAGVPAEAAPERQRHRAGFIRELPSTSRLLYNPTPLPLLLPSTTTPPLCRVSHSSRKRINRRREHDVNESVKKGAGLGPDNRLFFHQIRTVTITHVVKNSTFEHRCDKFSLSLSALTTKFDD